MKWLWPLVLAATAMGQQSGGAIDPREFSLVPFAGGEKLNLASLAGKVTVFEFWATWCTPCRAQYPLYQKVRQSFAGNPDVAFVFVNEDTDAALVKPFLAGMRWTEPVYLDPENRLAYAFRIRILPTTMVMTRGGRLYSRRNGYNPDSFAETLTQHIREALARDR